MSIDTTRKRSDALAVFFVLTFAITWGVGVFVVLLPGLAEMLFGKLSGASPLFILAVAGPTIAASILTFVRDGWPGLRALYARGDSGCRGAGGRVGPPLGVVSQG